MIGEFLAEANAELEEAFEFYEMRSAGLAADFRSEARHAFALVLERPELGNRLAEAFVSEN